MGLHDEGTFELGDPGAFLGELRAHFGDNMQAQQVEFEIQAIRQGSQPVMEYIQEFSRLVGKLRHWLEQLLVHYFRDSLNTELYYTCLPQGLPDWLQDWYQLATNMELNLRDGGAEIHLKKSQGRHLLGQKPPAMSAPSPTKILRHPLGPCFQCGQKVHQAAPPPGGSENPNSPEQSRREREY